MAKTTSSKNYITSRRPLVGDPIESVVYDAQNRPTTIVYKLGQAGKTEEVTLSYTSEGYLVFKGIEYRNYQLNLWEGIILPISFEPSSPAITDMFLSNSSVLDLSPAGTFIGFLSSEGGVAPFTYQITGGADFDKLAIQNTNELVLDYTAEISDAPLEVTITSFDARGQFFSKTFNIQIERIPITSISLDNDTIQENLPSGTLVGNLTASGGRPPYTFSLSGPDASNFQVVGAQLQTSTELDSLQTPYELEITATDSVGTQASFNFDINVTAEPYTSSLCIETNSTADFLQSSNTISLSSITVGSNFAFLQNPTSTRQLIRYRKLNGTVVLSLTVNNSFQLEVNVYDENRNRKRYRYSGASTGLTTNVWYQISVDYDQVTDSLKLVLNGNELTPTNTNINDNFINGMDDTPCELLLGGCPDTKYDEAYVWSKGLSSAELTELWNGGVTFNLKSHSAAPTSLLHWWKCGEDASVPTIPDQISNNDYIMISMNASNIVPITLPLSNLYSTLFDGLTETISIADDPTLSITNNLNIFCWVKTTSTVAFQACVSKFEGGTNNRSYYMGLTSLGELEVQVNAFGDLSNRKQYFSVVNGINDGDWHLIGFTFVSNVLKLYIDGVEVSVTTPINDTVNSIFDGTADVYIGTVDGVGRPFDGNIDEVNIWSEDVLSSTAVEELYNSGTPPQLDLITTSAVLESWWRMGDGDDATTIFDNEGSNDGTLINMNSSNYVTDVPG